MKKYLSLIAIAAAGLALTVNAQDEDDDQSDLPQITSQPVDQSVLQGDTAVFNVQANNGNGYQWMRNGQPMDGQTNDTLVVSNVGPNDVALYSCNVKRGHQVVPTRSTPLNMVIVHGTDPDIVVFGTPILSSGGTGDCPGPYAGYVNYRKTLLHGWGWAPDNSTTNHTATDTNRNDTKVEYLGKTGDEGCDATSVAVPDPSLSTVYRFTIYFTNNVPTNIYPIYLSGFNP